MQSTVFCDAPSFRRQIRAAKTVLAVTSREVDRAFVDQFLLIAFPARCSLD
jgi:hypothetical protein